MTDRNFHDRMDYYANSPPRNRAVDFETELAKYCTTTDIARYKLCKDSRGDYAVIGSGAFGKVYEAIDVGARRHVALKVMKKEHILANRFERRVLDEIRIHSKLMHPRIVEMYECFHDKKHVYIALELCPGGDLEHYLRRGALSEEKAASIFRQVVDGVLYLHRLKTDRDGAIVGNPVLHRDLKPSNICFAKDNSIKICDFNLAAEVLSDAQRNNTYCGTPGYMPPEVALSVPYSFEVDAYGLGCILHSMLFGVPPSKPHGGSSRFDVSIPNGVSSEAQGLLRNLLCKDGRHRMTVKSVAKDPFLVKFSQRKRVASIDSGFDTQHTGSSFPDSCRRGSSRERAILRPVERNVDVTQGLLATRRPPVMPVHPQHDDSAQIRHLPSVLPPLSQGRPNIRRSPAPSRSNRADHYDHGDLPGTSGDVGRFPCASNQTSGKPISPDSPTSKDNRGSNASKVRYVSKMAQYAYMPNGDFIARFSDGKVAMRKRDSEGVIVARDKRKAELTTLEAAHFQKVFRIVRALEQVCETECGPNASCDCFPVLLDKRQSSPNDPGSDRR